MSILHVARMGHPVLRSPANRIDRADIRRADVQLLIQNMLRTMVEYRSMALAAPQVYQHARLFVATLPSMDKGPLVLCNPEVTVIDKTLAEEWERCPSMPTLRGLVPRPRGVHVRGLDERGVLVELEARDFDARILQHAQDHLDGILYVDRISPLTSLGFDDIGSPSGRIL